MSLDVYLESDPEPTICTCESCGNEHSTLQASTLFSSNITHNLNKMADKAGIYQHLWRPDEIGIKKAKELIDPLSNGLEKMKSDPDTYKAYNASNGWGLYEHFVPFVQEYLEACKEYPEANVRVWR